MKKTVVLFLITALAIGFTACGDDDSSSSGYGSVVLASFDQLAGNTYTRTRTSGSDYETVNYSFLADGTYIETTEKSQSGSSTYIYRTGIWSLTGGRLVYIGTQEAQSSTSMIDAQTLFASASPIAETDRTKYEQVKVIATDTKLGFASMSGGNPANFNGVWGSLTTPHYRKYMMKDGVWTVYKEEYTKVTMTDALTNYQTMSKRMYNSDTSTWLTSPEYKIDSSGTWTSTGTTNSYPITEYYVLSEDGKLAFEVAGTTWMTNNYMVSSASIAFEPYTYVVQPK